MATFAQAYLALTKLVGEAKKDTGLEESTLLDLIKTQLIYGSAPVTDSVEEPPVAENITGEETEFTEDTDGSVESAGDNVIRLH